ncbi:MAG: hypothetical protein HYZ93_04570 [Candidatus Omnitrophica bacterium]|nr:hypothetical protein [Candidatus Omnitrophota bacterium]
MNAKKTERSIEALHAGAIKALETAVAKALEQHESAGVPAAIWRNGRVVLLSGSQLRKRRK